MFVTKTTKWPILLILLAISLGPFAPRTASSGPSEYILKAAFLHKFLLFADFPDSAFEADPDSVTICIYGKNPFGNAFKPVLGKKTKGRTLKLMELKPGFSKTSLRFCQILFLGKENSDEEKKGVLRSVREKPLLTIGENGSFLKWGGLIRIFLKKDRVVFEVNAGVARRRKIFFRSQMLRIAERVLDDEVAP